MVNGGDAIRVARVSDIRISYDSAHFPHARAVSGYDRHPFGTGTILSRK
jgi:hypothetical protein